MSAKQPETTCKAFFLHDADPASMTDATLTISIKEFLQSDYRNKFNAFEVKKYPCPTPAPPATPVPTLKPTAIPTAMPTAISTAEPTVEPTSEPSTPEPTNDPTDAPSEESGWDFSAVTPEPTNEVLTEAPSTEPSPTPAPSTATPAPQTAAPNSTTNSSELEVCFFIEGTDNRTASWLLERALSANESKTTLLRKLGADSLACAFPPDPPADAGSSSLPIATFVLAALGGLFFIVGIIVISFLLGKRSNRTTGRVEDRIDNQLREQLVPVGEIPEDDEFRNKDQEMNMMYSSQPPPDDTPFVPAAATAPMSAKV